MSISVGGLLNTLLTDMSTKNEGVVFDYIKRFCNPQQHSKLGYRPRYANLTRCPRHRQELRNKDFHHEQ
jgi:hypothetical protein